MLMLLFQVADEPWAIAATEVKDLIPLVALQPYTGAAFSGKGETVDEALATNEALATERRSVPISGLLNYHGEHLPVIDVAQLVACQCAPSALSTRIAIVELAADGEAAPQKRGLILDRAYETADLSKTVDLPLNSPYINATLQGPDGIVQQLEIASFF